MRRSKPSDASEIQVLIQNALAQHPMNSWQTFALMILVMAVAGYFGTYLREKGKNLATKEDVKIITGEIEKVRSDYKKEESRYQLQVIGLLTKRADIIEQLYQRIVDIEEAYNRVVDFAEWPDEPSKDELRKKAGAHLFSFLREYKKNRIYFSEDLCKKLQGFVDLIYSRFMPYSIALTAKIEGENLKNYTDTWVKANDAFKIEIPLARQAIEDEFRVLLGTNVV